MTEKEPTTRDVPTTGPLTEEEQAMLRAAGLKLHDLAPVQGVDGPPLGPHTLKSVECILMEKTDA